MLARGALKLLSKLPLSILYLFSKSIYFLLYYIVQYKKINVVNNIAIAYSNKNSNEQAAIVRAFYKNYSDVLIELIHLQSINAGAVLKHVTIQNKELLENHLNNGQPILVVTSHQCNVDWLIQAASIEFNYPVYFIHKPIKNNLIEQLIINIRGKFGAKPIYIGTSLEKIILPKDEPRIIAMASDQSPLKKGDAYWLTFMGHETAFHVGMDIIARLTRYPVLFISMQRIKRGKYQAKIIQLTDPKSNKKYAEGEVTQAYAQLLEEQILNAPGDWLWINRRWKKVKTIDAV